MNTLTDVLSGNKLWAVEHGNALKVLRQLPDACADSMVTDPPSGIGFMGKEWDLDKGGRDKWIAWLAEIAGEALRVLKPGAHALVWAIPRTSHWTALALEDAGFEIIDVFTHHFGSGFPKSTNASKAVDAYLFRQWLKDHPCEKAWWDLSKKLEKWLKKLPPEKIEPEWQERLNRVQSAVIDAYGFRRTVVSIYTAGGNAGTSISDKGGTYVVGAPNSDAVVLTRTTGATPEAKEWDGWGTAMKPASEHWILCRKPKSGSIAQNLLKHGVGAMNIDGTRVRTDWNEPDRPDSWKKSGHTADPDAEKIAAPPGEGINLHPDGRWPANVVFTHSAGCVRRGTATVAGDNRGDCSGRRDGGFFATGSKSGTGEPNARVYGTETVPDYDCAPDCPVAELARQSGQSQSGIRRGGSGESLNPSQNWRFKRAEGGFQDADTAARFFHQFEWDEMEIELNALFLYTAKASRAEREAGCEGLPEFNNGIHNIHPTVKAEDLMRHLVRLVTPRKGICIDPFTGSGSTGVACMKEGVRFIGAELNDSKKEPFATIARARIAHAAGERSEKQALEDLFDLAMGLE